MPSVLLDLVSLLGLLLRAIGFLLVGLAFGRIVFDNLKLARWEMQAVFILGLFGLLIALTAFSSPGSAGAFALGVGIAYFIDRFPRKTEPAAEVERNEAPISSL